MIDTKILPETRPMVALLKSGEVLKTLLSRSPITFLLKWLPLSFVVVSPLSPLSNVTMSVRDPNLPSLVLVALVTLLSSGPRRWMLR
ncbi:hypothetical protein RO3G_13017 [Rhizopus delemar RA 99-880]|uniref:Uncharacterized protein n=1 Tax=Rhizopus delemar (strain RA 99-880 / ATCC MYA-4621 / FGSC 9543 / NRRL 43880) TaxID=246409 RepID=I1CIM6_RHIO9|nr:hypothetical protein RO3G_13017 [Rhizopus delemar RA 99-880]|eukprot:EIE88306.1 hypothetical protein RO3G_13017 [Rhizopus delemar RA 99-880]